MCMSCGGGGVGGIQHFPALSSHNFPHRVNKNSPLALHAAFHPPHPTSSPTTIKSDGRTCQPSRLLVLWVDFSHPSRAFLFEEPQRPSKERREQKSKTLSAWEIGENVGERK